MVRESVAEIVDKLRAFCTSVVLLAGRMDERQATGKHLYLVPSLDPDS